jgi:long-chain acyl-CoA synthetase
LPIPPATPLQDTLKTAAGRWPQRTAIDFYGQELTFPELDDLARRAAKGFRQLGVGNGVHVGLHLENTPHFLVCFFGVLYAGGSVVNFNPHAGTKEFVGQLVDSQVSILVTGDWQSEFAATRKLVADNSVRLVGCSLSDFLPEARVAELVDRALRQWSCDDTEERFAALIANDGVLEAGVGDQIGSDIAVIQYTGGTTGDPKGAMLTHANFFAVLHMLLQFTGGSFNDRQYKILCVLPMWHVFGLTFIMLRSVATGTEMVLHLRFDAGRVLSDIAQKQITAFSGVPAMYAALVKHSKFLTEDLTSVLSWTSGGAPFPGELKALFEQRARVDIHEGYALTETAGIAAQALTPDRLATFCVGLPAPNTIIEIVDIETGTKPLPSGEHGEICISGPQVMKGYWMRPDENAAAFEGGRFHTGDVGFLDANGFLTVLDRKKDMILVGGHCVYPRNIERVLNEHPAVAEAAVVGVPNPDFGEVGHACLVLRPGHNPPQQRDLYAFLADRLSTHEIPLTFEILEELPRTAAGKVKKRELAGAREQLEAGRAA